MVSIERVLYDLIAAIIFFIALIIISKYIISRFRKAFGDKTFYDDFQEMQYRLIEKAERAFRTQMWMSQNMFLIGMILIFISIIIDLCALLGIIKVEWYELLVGGGLIGSLGIANIVTTFFRYPQKRIDKSIGNLGQMHIILISYLEQIRIVSDSSYQHKLVNTEKDPKQITEQDKPKDRTKLFEIIFPPNQYETSLKIENDDDIQKRIDWIMTIKESSLRDIERYIENSDKDTEETSGEKNKQNKKKKPIME